jgi:hypothetical protein
MLEEEEEEEEEGSSLTQNSPLVTMCTTCINNQ